MNCPTTNEFTCNSKADSLLVLSQHTIVGRDSEIAPTESFVL